MPLRMFHLVPQEDPKLYTTPHRYRLSDPSLISQVLPPQDANLDDTIMASRIHGLIKAALAMDVDIVVLSPPESYRDLLELKLTNAGLIVAYEDYAILDDGSLFKAGYRLATVVPAGPRSVHAQNAFDDWVTTRLNSIPESELWKVIDPWTTFLQHELRSHYQNERETSH